MDIRVVNTKKEKRQYKDFRRKLYCGDPFYVSTVEFTVDMLLKKETAFAKSIDICPVLGMKKSEILLSAMLIHCPKDDFLQVAFFEAVEGLTTEIDSFMEYAKERAKALGLKRIILGLNGHLSYGVGLSLDMARANTFDSAYTKLYYPEYFQKFKTHKLVAFSNALSQIKVNLPMREDGITVRTIDFSDFKNEMERFRKVCDRTIGKTFLYSPTDPGHFEDLIGSMRFFLKKENILFAERDGEVVGFLFWHPDYNELLKKGKHNSLLGIAVRYTLLRKRIKRVKLNSVGVMEEYQGFGTAKLLQTFEAYARKYSVAETNFVWCSNQKSMLINKAAFRNIERTFAVYEVEI